MNKLSATIWVPLAILAIAATACAAPPTPTPTATAPPTATPTTFVPSPSPPPTSTQTPTSAPPSPTSIPPTKTVVRATPKPQASATPSRPRAPQGSIAYHWNDQGVNRASIFNFEPRNVTPLVVLGFAMDLELGTNAHLGEFSPDDSKIVYVYARRLGEQNILRVDEFKTGTLTPLYTSEAGGGVSGPTWSPDGARVAFVLMLKNQATFSIDVVNGDGTGLTQIRGNPNGEQYRGGVSWSRLNVLAFAENLNGPSSVWKMNSDGSGAVNLSNDPKADDSAPVWSPDGKQVAFVSNRDGLSQIYVMNADGSGARRISRGGGADLTPSWSPDGNWIAFTSTRSGSTDIYIMDLHGGNLTRLTTTGADHPMWSR